VKLQTQLNLIAAGLILTVSGGALAASNGWSSLGLTLAADSIEFSAFWILTSIPVRKITSLARQVNEVAAGSRAVVNTRSRTTEMRQMRGALDIILLRLQASKKTMHQFLGDASHELRTPLTVISAYLELLSQPEAKHNDEFLEKSLNKMNLEASRMQRLIEDLLQLAEIGEGNGLGRIEQVDLAGLVTIELDSLRDLQPGRHIEAYVNGPVVVPGNPELLAQLCANLFSNIRRHTSATAAVRVELVEGASWVTLTVNDAGPGLTDAAYEAGTTHFERFDKSRSRETGGSGLGMSIMTSIVERHGGRVSLSRSDMGGLCTRITLPA
jgi:two-component system OmpR family sensor kinase